MNRSMEREETDTQTKKTRNTTMFFKIDIRNDMWISTELDDEVAAVSGQKLFRVELIRQFGLDQTGIEEAIDEAYTTIGAFLQWLRSIYFKYGIRINGVVNLIVFDDRDLRVWDEKLNGSIFSINSLINRVFVKFRGVIVTSKSLHCNCCIPPFTC